MTMDGGTGFGGRIAGNIVDLASRATVATRAAMGPVHRKVVAMALDDFFELTGGELRTTMGPLMHSLADNPDLHPDVQNTLRFVGNGKGQFATMLGNGITGTAIGTGLGALLANLLQPVTGRAIAVSPNLPISVSDAVRAHLAGLTHGMDMRFEVAQQGINSTAFDVLVDLAHARPDVSELLDLLNRGEISEGSVRAGMEQLGYSGADAESLITLRRALIDPARLADLVTFGTLSQDDAARMAASSGMSATDFDILVRGNGMPPSTQELLFAYRRGVIDKARLLRGVTQGPLRNEWFDVIESFGQVPMSISDAIRAAVQNHLSMEQAKQIAIQNGLIPEQFQPLFDSAGSPPGPQETLDLLNRGLMTEAEATQALRESHLKNEYIPLILQSRYRIPPMIQVMSLVRKKIISPEKGLQYLAEHGFQPEIAKGLIDSAQVATTTAGKDLSVSQIRQLYHDRQIDQAGAVDMLIKLGYDHQESEALLKLTDIARGSRLTTALVTRVHHAFIMRLMSDVEASAALDQAGIDSVTRDEDLAVWRIEQTTVRRGLTEAQVAKFVKKGTLTADEGYNRLLSMGYSADDAGLLIADVAPTTPTAA